MLAPLVLFVYNRPELTKRTLTALQKNELADRTVLYIYSDGAKDYATDLEKNKINKVRELIREEKWCHEVYIRESPINKGLADSIISGVSEVLNEYEKIIIIEDDVITSPYFIKFMNDALTIYEKQEEVLSIGSWNYFTNSNTIIENFFLRMPDTIAWATWKRSWQLFESDTTKLYRQLIDKNKIDKLNLDNKYNFEKMIISQINGEVNSWGIRWTAVAILNNKLTFYPKVSLSKHIGFGEESTHCFTHDFNTDLKLADHPINVTLLPLTESKEAISSWLSFEKTIKKSADIINDHPRNVKRSNLLKKIFRRILKRFFNISKKDTTKSPWSGDYKSWQDAKKLCSGYDSESILEKVKQSSLKVKNGEAAYECDSVIFDKIYYTPQILEAFKKASVEFNGKLHVIDFGGSLGSSFYQMTKLLEKDALLKWSIVEQENFVLCGKEFFTENTLAFFFTIEEALLSGQAHILLLSSVLQYLEKPYDFLENIINLNFPFIFIDRTAFVKDINDKLTCQTVPPSIYSASYPSWFLVESKVIHIISKRYQVIDEFENDVDPKEFVDGKWTYRKGFILKRK